MDMALFLTAITTDTINNLPDRAAMICSMRADAARIKCGAIFKGEEFKRFDEGESPCRAS